ncbi:MAG: PorT family protein [Prevotellaceae bacterium]|nr:PorT family protein [Prevotellaceae bacterium]
MKKTIILAITAIVLATGAFAQEKKIEFGVKAGLNLAQEYTEDANTTARIGLHAGVFAEFFISNRLGLQPELLYSMQGGKDNTGTDKLDYINLPVILKIYVLNRDLSIDVGLQAGYLLSANTSFKSGTDLDIYERCNKFDVAVAFGASYKFAEKFHVGLRYNIGTIKIAKTLEHRNRVSQLYVGMKF